MVVSPRYQLKMLCESVLSKCIHFDSLILLGMTCLKSMPESQCLLLGHFIFNIDILRELFFQFPFILRHVVKFRYNGNMKGAILYERTVFYPPAMQFKSGPIG